MQDTDGQDVLRNVLLGFVPSGRETLPTKDVNGGLGIAGWAAIAIGIKLQPTKVKGIHCCLVVADHKLIYHNVDKMTFIYKTRDTLRTLQLWL